MSMRYPNGGFITASYNPVLVPGAPTIDTATTIGTNVSVTFTAPTNIGGSAITSYQVVSTPGNIIATGSGSPIVVTGLTNGTAYTFRVAAINSYGQGNFSVASNSVTSGVGQEEYTSPGTYSWTAPEGVTSVSVVTVGGSGGGGGGDLSTGDNRGGGGGGGGGLSYLNDIAVTPGTTYAVVVGAGGSGGSSRQPGTSGEASSFGGTLVVAGAGIGGAGSITSGAGGGGGSGTAGDGGSGSTGSPTAERGGGGGGAGGYAGSGGGGATSGSGTDGSGGGGGGGASSGGGGGVGIYGQGSNGLGGASIDNSGTGGSGGTPATSSATKTGGVYGGGGGGGTLRTAGGSGRSGAVRIIWPGNTRSFPSTNTGDL